MQIIGVYELSLKIKIILETHFKNINVKGEICQLSRSTRGHTYINLSEKDSIISGVLWKGVRIPKEVSEGVEVICVGRITTYQSRYQISIQEIVKSGNGELAAILRERKNRLAKEGLFDQENKQELPKFPSRVGVITSPTGAVIHDIKQRIAERCPINIVIWPTLVQGDEAPGQIARAIKGLNQLEDAPQIIIIARGGGSTEDLWTFNEEEILKAVHESRIPIISAIGHETDTTLIDLVADVRAPTPSAAAEIAVPNIHEISISINSLRIRLENKKQHIISSKEQHLRNIKIPHPKRLIDLYTQKLTHYKKLYDLLVLEFLNKKTSKLNETAKTIDLIQKGFAVLFNNNGERISPTDNIEDLGLISVAWGNIIKKAKLENNEKKSL